MPHQLPRSARLPLRAARISLVGSIVIAGLATQTVADGPGSGHADDPMTDQPIRLQRVLDRHDCSVTGFADSAPGSAIIRSGAGRLEHVSFDTGWKVYTRRGDATLVAVCLDEAPRDSRR